MIYQETNMNICSTEEKKIRFEDFEVEFQKKDLTMYRFGDYRITVWDATPDYLMIDKLGDLSGSIFKGWIKNGEEFNYLITNLLKIKKS